MSLPQSEPEGLPRYDTQPCPGPEPHGVTGDCPVCAGLGLVPAADTPNPVWPEVLVMLREPLSNRLWAPVSRAIVLGTPVDIAMFSALSRRDQEARELLRQGTTEPWFAIKQHIWERDNFVCQACGLDLEEYPARLTVGHKIDKTCGGSDQPVNLCLQCSRCNSRKPRRPVGTSPPPPMGGLDDVNCRGIKSNGEPCKQNALTGKAYCVWHSDDPEDVAERQRMSSKGGKVVMSSSRGRSRHSGRSSRGSKKTSASWPRTCATATLPRTWALRWSRSTTSSSEG